MPFFSSIENMMLALGLTLPRIIGAFVMLPLISPQNMPAMVRNSFLVSLAIVALPLVVTTAPPAPHPQSLAGSRPSPPHPD